MSKNEWDSIRFTEFKVWFKIEKEEVIIAVLLIWNRHWIEFVLAYLIVKTNNVNEWAIKHTYDPVNHTKFL